MSFVKGTVICLSVDIALAAATPAPCRCCCRTALEERKQKGARVNTKEVRKATFASTNESNVYGSVAAKQIDAALRVFVEVQRERGGDREKKEEG